MIRFDAQHPCPVCGGHSRLPSGRGVRCVGFLSDDALWAHCTRQEYAGSLEPDSATPPTYPHRLEGACQCGQPHGGAQLAPRTGGRSSKHSPLIVDSPEEFGRRFAGGADVLAVYPYRDGANGLVFNQVRFLDRNRGKMFRPFVLLPDGRWRVGMNGGEPPPYRLPELLSADPNEFVLVVEGERDADRLAALGFVATCSDGGAGCAERRWPALAKHFHGRRVAVLRDNDEAGSRYRDCVLRALSGVAAELRVVDLPSLAIPGGDVSDWLDAGHGAEELKAVVRTSPVSRFLGSAYTANRETEKPRNGAQFALISVGDLMSEAAEETDWLAFGLLPIGGVVSLTPKPKVGKSTLARYLALCVARGADFLGRPTKQGGVIYLALEEKRAEVRKHFGRMGAAAGDPILVHVGAAPQDALAPLVELIKEHEPLLVVVDPLFRFTRIRDAGDYAEITNKLEPVVEAARTSGACLVLVHHDRKAEAHGGDAILGSTAIFGAVDTALMLKRRPDNLRVAASVQRYGDDLPETVLALDPETACVSVAGAVADIERAEYAKRLVDLLAPPALLPESDIREVIGGNQSKGGTWLRDLVKEGVVVRTGSGKRGDPYLYSLPRTAETGLTEETEEVQATEEVPEHVTTAFGWEKRL